MLVSCALQCLSPTYALTSGDPAAVPADIVIPNLDAYPTIDETLAAANR